MSKKRPHEVIDLTQDSSPARPAPQRPTKTRRAEGPVYLPTPASSSQPGRSSQTIHEEFPEEDLVDDIDLSQNFDSYLSSLILYGTLDTKIVGCRFYDGYVTTGEMVMLQREPSNPYDANAIKVLNVRSEQIGHIPRQIAAKLATFMDNCLLSVEACTSGPKDYFECPLRVQLFGPSDPIQRNDIKERMRAQKLPTTAWSGLRLVDQDERQRARSHAEQIRQLERQRMRNKKMAGKKANGTQQAWEEGAGQWVPMASQGIGEASSQSLDQIMQDAERFNPRQDFDKMVDKFGFKEEDLAKMELAPQPAMLKARLLPFQRQGLHWLLDKENPVLPPRGSDDIVQLWKQADRPGIVTNIATHFSLQNQLPELASGGILADDMGLGKTVQVISLIVADRTKSQLQPSSKSTLILAPLSVMSNWSKQIEQHVKEEHALSVLIYHGSNRVKLTPQTIQNYDVVITTYETVMSEYWNGQSKPRAVPRSSGLFSISWRRVVLDEGHTIRNPQAKKSVAAYNLIARSRWLLTGTPIVNTLKDLFSMVKFLRLSGGLDRWELFNSAIIRPVMNQDERGQYLLQTLMQNISLRRKKNMPFVDLKLPELTEYIQRISFTSHEKEKYNALQSEAKGELERVRKGQGQKAIQAYHHLLEVLLRLRQVCNHWKLCGEGRIQIPDVVGEALDLTPENRAALQDMLQMTVDAQDDCPVCMECVSNRDPVITACTHVFCYGCAERFINEQHKCPMCRARLESVSMLLRLPQESSQPEFDVEESSSKVEAMLQILRASQKKSGTKTVVFSQWTSFLDVVQKQLVKNDIKYTRIDGKMRSHMRDAAMKALEEDEQCTVLLASLSVCSVGLNLVAANQVILADTWWAPAIEDQAVDRVHRLGQTKPCTVFRLVMEDTVEEQVLKIQEDKRKLAQLAFADKDGKKETKKNARLEDIARILGS